MARETGLDVSLLIALARAGGEEEVLESESDSELEVRLGSAFRLRPFTRSLTIGFREAAGFRS